MKQLFTIFTICALGALLWVAYSDIEIRWKPVIYITMEPNTTNTLYTTESLTNEWVQSWFLHDHVVGTNRQRMLIESSDFDENTKQGFFKLEVNGVMQTNIVENVTTNQTVTVPPTP